MKVWCAVPEDGCGWSLFSTYVPVLVDADALSVGYVNDGTIRAWSSFGIGVITALTVVEELPELPGQLRRVYGVMRPGDAEHKRLGAFRGEDETGADAQAGGGRLRGVSGIVG